MFDCIIIGAGPAGGSAAYHLAKRGRSVLVLEREKLPRYKPCSGGVSPEVAKWFDFDFAPVICGKVDTIRFTWKLDDPVLAKLNTPEPMWMVQRDVFDQFLIQQGQSQGSEVRDGVEVKGIGFQADHWQVQTAQETLSARYLIAADGARGPMAKWLGFKERKSRTAVSLETAAPVPAAESHMAGFDFGTLKNGCFWSFPKTTGQSIGIATFRGNDDPNVQKELTEYTKKTGIDLQAAKQQSHPLCLWDGDQPLHAQNALLAGEAACLVDPFTAEGIRPALFSGMKAAEAIDQALSGQAEALKNYTQVIQSTWGADLLWAQRLAGAFYSFPGIGYKVGVKYPTASERMGQILCGELHYADVVNRALKRLSTSFIPGMGR